MGIGIGILLIAIGAVLKFAVDVTVQGINLDTVGVILMLVGALGTLFSLLFWSFDRYPTTRSEIIDPADEVEEVRTRRYR